MKNNSNDTLSAIKNDIRSIGARVTSARIQVLDFLRKAQAPLSHSDIEKLLIKNALPAIDRITLYRVLDWLVDVGLAHTAANTRGVFCFTASNTNLEHKQHIHFRCNDCCRVICLDMPPPSVPELPKGFQISSIELEISGACSDCVENRSQQNSLSLRLA